MALHVKPYADTRQAQTSLADWVARWRTVHTVAPSTQAKYDHYLDCHILPAFGGISLDAIRRMAVKEWAAQMATRYAPATVSGIITLLSVVLTAAVEERMIAFNPVQGLRLGGRQAHRAVTAATPRRKRPVPTGEQILRIAERAETLGGRRAYVMVIADAFTGMRWGEITGLARTNCRTADAHILIDPDVGALHEVKGHLWLGPPKSAAAARRIDLPPFLIDLLEEVMDDHGHEQLFVSAAGVWQRRSHFSRRIWRPACDGDPARGWEPILSGAVFHGLRHHHKTMLDEADLPEVLKHERMGHEMPGIQGVYSHVTDAMRKQVIKALQRRWIRMARRGSN